MKSWQILSPQELKAFEANDPPLPQEGEARVKISEVLLDVVDLSVYTGEVSVDYPMVPGRYAVGKITTLPEGYVGMLEKGNRVFIDPHFPEKHFTGDSTPLQGMKSIKIAGISSPGFLTPLATVPQENLRVLPDSVKDEDALFTYLVALALTAVDKLGDIKGKYISVFGATALGIILCHILSYYQAVPIIIDSRTARLDFARHTGVTYAFLNDDSLDSYINSCTGGAFTDGSVYVPSGGNIVSTNLFRVTAPGKSVVFCGMQANGLQAGLELALKKEITILGVSKPGDNLSSAINLLANKAVSFGYFASDVYQFADLQKAFNTSLAVAEDKNQPQEYLSIIDCFGKL